MYEVLLKLCKERGISITNLCLEITGSRGNLNTWKKGNINPVSLTKIADYFGVSTDYLLGRTDIQKSESEISDFENTSTDDFKGLSSDQWEELARYARYLKWQKKAS